MIEYINAQGLIKEMGAEPSIALNSDDDVDFDIVNHNIDFSRRARLRKAWVWAHRDEMRHLVTAMKSCALEQRSLRRLLSRTLIDQTQLFHLFPVWGSTLLSLGNVFPPEFESIDYVVVDEGGQCHPAYVVFAFMRAKHAMIIGDVHQLEPIFTLSVDEETRILEALDGASKHYRTRISSLRKLWSFRSAFSRIGLRLTQEIDRAFSFGARNCDHLRQNMQLWFKRPNAESNHPLRRGHIDGAPFNGTHLWRPAKKPRELV